MENQPIQPIPATSNKWKPIAIIFIIISVILAGLSAFFIAKSLSNKDDNKNNEESSKEKGKDDEENEEITELEKGTFNIADYAGTVQVRGYATAQEFCDMDEPDDCEEYVTFNILEIKNDDFLQWINGMEGNSFVGNSAIGLGCLISNKLTYWNASDSKGMQKYTLTANDTSEIMATTEESPIALNLERLQFSSGSGAPNCYSHMTTITIIR